jgi:hypothetical protein
MLGESVRERLICGCKGGKREVYKIFNFCVVCVRIV